MAEKIIKARLFTWFQDGESPAVPGEMVRMERISHFGEEVDVDDEASLKRGEELGAFYSDEDAEAIKDGTYNGTDAGLLALFREGGQRPGSQVQAVEGEGPQTGDLSSEDLATYISENRLTVDETVALAKEGDVDSINRVYDAEVGAAQQKGAEPRKGVTDRLDTMLAAATES